MLAAKFRLRSNIKNERNNENKIEINCASFARSRDERHFLVIFPW